MTGQNDRRDESLTGPRSGIVRWPAVILSLTCDQAIFFFFLAGKKKKKSPDRRLFWALTQGARLVNKAGKN